MAHMTEFYNGGFYTCNHTFIDDTRYSTTQYSIILTTS